MSVALSSGYTQTIPLTPEFLTLLDEADGICSHLLFFVTHFFQYYLHGYFEAILIIDGFEGDHQLGKYQFFVLYKLLGELIGLPITFEAVTEGLSRVGVYDTFFGAAFVDFSHFMILFAGCVGYLSGSVWRAFRNGDLFYGPLSLMLSYIVFLAPIVNGFLFSGGVFYLFSFALVILISRAKL